MNELVQIGPISPLRQRLLDDMALRRLGLETQRNYLRDVSRFATWLQRCGANWLAYRDHTIYFNN